MGKLSGTYGEREGVHTVGSDDEEWEASGGDDEEKEVRRKVEKVKVEKKG